jgi:hypothetical protein
VRPHRIEAGAEILSADVVLLPGNHPLVRDPLGLSQNKSLSQLVSCRVGKRGATHQIALAYVVGGAALTHRCRFPGGRRWVPGAGAKPGGCAPEAAQLGERGTLRTALTDEIRDAIDAMEAVVAKDDDPAVKAGAGGPPERSTETRRHRIRHRRRATAG